MLRDTTGDAAKEFGGCVSILAVVVRLSIGGAVMASHSAPLARPQDEGIALPYVEDENAASGVEGRQNRPLNWETYH